MDDDRLLSAADSRFLANALERVKIRFIRSIDNLNKAEGYAPEFAHQHFGENEVIYGYQDLQLKINYTDASMYIYPQIKYEKSILQEDKLAKPDDILTLLKEQLPKDQMNTMVESKDMFIQHLERQQNFKPYGIMIQKFTAGDKVFELFKVEGHSDDFDAYLTRIQTLALWYIDASDYTDNSDPRWVHYLLYESYASPEGDGSRRFALAGYTSCYRFYHYPGAYRVRIAQIMLFPQFRQGGIGPLFLLSIYRDFYSQNDVYDITAEDPADNFIFLRDYVDCLNCQNLEEFSPDKLKMGFSEEMRTAALENFKMHKKQTRRVYEILRYSATDKTDAEAVKAYRIDVKRRLEGPIKRSKNEWNRINRALEPEDLSRLAAAEMNPEVKMHQLSSMYEETISAYKQVINRLENYPKIV